MSNHTQKLKNFEERLELLQDAMFSGEMTVKHRDRTVIYHSFDQMLKAEGELKSRIFQLKNKCRPTSYTVSPSRCL